MSSRAAILDALRKGRGGPALEPQFLEVDERALFRDYPNTDLVQAFADRFAALSGELILAEDADDGAKRLSALLDQLQGDKAVLKCAAQSFELLDALVAADEKLRRQLKDASDLPTNAVELSEFDVGITRADCVIARTGSLFIQSATSGGRQLSVLPPVHVAVATRSQVVPSLGDVLQRFGSDDESSFGTFISGPSRTADIEKVLVLGAHGPRRLVVLLLP